MNSLVNTMEVSVCCWALSSLAHGDILDAIVEEGVSVIDVRTSDVETPEQRLALRDSGLRVGCLSLAFALWDLPPLSGDSPITARTEAERGISLAASLGAPVVYLCPDEDGSKTALERFATELTHLASFAEVLGVVLCVEHFPGLALSTIAETARFLRNIGHPNLKLLIDVGHAQISKESASGALRDHADILGYLHVNDNHGGDDTHLGLLEGMMKRETLVRTIEEAKRSTYNGPVSLELSWTLEDSVGAVRRSIKILKELT